jgi:hypothetical protein
MKIFCRLTTWTILSAYNKICLVMLVSLSYHPFINPIVNPADILSVNGIPKLVIANEDDVAAAAILYNRIKQKKQEMHRTHYRSDTDRIFGQR